MLILLRPMALAPLLDREPASAGEARGLLGLSRGS